MRLLLLILLPLLVYAQSLGNDFVAFDDELLILDNPKAHGLTLEHVWQAFTTYDPELYVPLTLLSYQIEWSLFGDNPVPYHVMNLALHLVNVLLVFQILRRLMADPPSHKATAGRTAALVLSLLFAVHPLHTEAVAWASARKDLLSATFFLGSLDTYFVYRETGRHYLISIVLFALGLLAKVSIVPLPFVLLLTDWLQGRPIDRTCLREKIPYFLLAVLFLGIALYGKSKQASFPTVSLFLSFVSIPLYLKNFFWPSGLSIFYPFTEELSLTQPQILGGLLLIIGLSIAAWWSLRRTRVLAFGWVFFLLLLVPSFVNVVKGGAHGFYDLYIGSDRYAYLASIGILVPLGSLLSTRWLTVLLPIILVLAVATFRQSLTWHSSEALFAQVIRHHENSHVAYNNLGGILAKNRKYTEASQLFEKSLAIKKTSKSLYNIGQVYTALQQYPEAIAAYQQLVTLDPRHAHGHAKLGGLLLMLGNVPEAFENLQRAEELDKQIPSVYYNLGLIYEKLGQQEEARRSFERVLELDQRDPQALQKLGR